MEDKNNNQTLIKKRRGEQIRQALSRIRKIREGMDGWRPYGIMSFFDKKRGGGRLADGLVKINLSIFFIFW